MVTGGGTAGDGLIALRQGKALRRGNETDSPLPSSIVAPGVMSSRQSVSSKTKAMASIPYWLSGSNRTTRRA